MCNTCHVRQRKYPDKNIQTTIDKVVRNFSSSYNSYDLREVLVVDSNLRKPSTHKFYAAMRINTVSMYILLWAPNLTTKFEALLSLKLSLKNTNPHFWSHSLTQNITFFQNPIPGPCHWYFRYSSSPFHPLFHFQHWF